MSTANNYSSDRPISVKGDDKFQRYEFSKRIAQTIINRKEEDCIVIGVYGAWGEGKTSVMNFIESELKLDPKVTYIKFNPWRFGNENSLLIQFFHQFAAALDAKITTGSEKAGELIKKYSKLINVDLPFVGNIGEAVGGLGEAMSEVSIEALKERIEKIITATENKIVVFIDDIDRLDKSEIYSIFKLVKLNADFKNTTYILSFDEKMVSSAIGDRFGSGNQEAGRNFLEKIVQVPLEIPVAQPEDLKNFCFRLIEGVLDLNKIELSQDDISRFALQFQENILGKLETPRLAVRYSNSISFSLPLLHGEANMVDLMLIEAVKVFYPQYYNFIKLNPEFFIGSYKEKYSEQKDEDKVKELAEHLNDLNKTLTKRQQKEIKQLLIALFPLFENAFRNIGYSDNSYKAWIKEKRIGSPNYFDRYFSYSVIRGQISDVAFTTFINNINDQSPEMIAEAIKEIVSVSSPEKFLFKMRVMEDEFTWEIAQKLSKAICIISEVFPHPQTGFIFSFTTPQAQAAIFVKFLIKIATDKAEQFKLAKELLSESKQFVFADELLLWLLRAEKEGDELFNKDESSELTSILLKRALEEAGTTPLFEKFPTQTRYLFVQWNKENPANFKSYIKELVNKSPEKIVGIIRSFAPTLISTSHPTPFNDDFNEESFNSLTSVIDEKCIEEMVKKVFTTEELNQEVTWTRKDGGLTDIILIRQFMHWSKSKK